MSSASNAGKLKCIDCMSAIRASEPLISIKIEESDGDEHSDMTLVVNHKINMMDHNLYGVYYMELRMMN